MSWNVAVKFTIGSGDVDFYDSEFCAIEEIPEQNTIEHKFQQKASLIKNYDKQYLKLSLSISDEYSDTYDKILSIINENDEMVFYPHYQYDSTRSYNVILFPDMVKKTYTMGEREALLIVTFNLLESSK